MSSLLELQPPPQATEKKLLGAEGRFRFSPAKVAREALASAAFWRGDRDVALIEQIDPQLPDTIDGEGDLLLRVLCTLLYTSITCTERGIVALSARRVGGPERSEALRIVVTDTGLGGVTDVAAETARPMLRRFGGTLRVDTAAGIGTCFTIEIPLTS